MTGLFIAIGVVGSISIIMIGLLYLQRNHYEFQSAQTENADLLTTQLENEERWKEFDDYKRRVDALTLKAGFKL